MFLKNKSDERIVKTAMVGIRDNTTNAEEFECKSGMNLFVIAQLIIRMQGMHKSLIGF